jgi:hypothetical protein
LRLAAELEASRSSWTSVADGRGERIAWRGDWVLPACRGAETALGELFGAWETFAPLKGLEPGESSAVFSPWARWEIAPPWSTESFLGRKAEERLMGERPEEAVGSDPSLGAGSLKWAGASTGGESALGLDSLRWAGASARAVAALRVGSSNWDALAAWIARSRD